MFAELLQTLDVEPITDPAEIAELEERIKRAEEAMLVRGRREALEILKKPTPAEVLKLARQLSADERVVLINKLAAQQVPGQRMKGQKKQGRDS